MIRPKVYLLYIPDERSGDHENLIFPNGLYYIYANLLDNDIDCDLIMLFRSNIEEFSDILESGDVIGISVNSGNVRDSLLASEYLKVFSNERSLELDIVMGGPFISLMEDSVLESVEYVDRFFKNESEYTFTDYVKNRSSRKSLPKIIRSERIRKLDEMMIPSQKGLIYSNIMTSRGCPGRCTFCSSKLLWKRRVYFRSAESVFQEMSTLYENGVDYFVFSDDTFTMKKSRLKKLFTLINESSMRIVFDFRSRADYMDEEMIKLLAEAGAVSVSLGIESADEKVLSILKKDIDLKKAEKAVRLCNENGIRTNLFFIVGCPGEDESSIEKNIDFIKKVSPDWITVYGLHFFPGTELTEEFLVGHDWLSHDKTIYYKDLEIIKKRKKLMLESLNRKNQKYLASNIPKGKLYRSMFWKFDLMASASDDKKEAQKLLERSLKLYPSPEVMYKLAIIKDDEKLMKKALKKFIFQKENDIRKDLSFIKSCAMIFEENGLFELYNETLQEIEFLEMNRQD
ncbi:MAG: hypothetical protein C0601_06475 [Candidatus Muiribacterium halophilum]|uniref:Radical SAM core domain-containing protein n=1 Tax=Muiribacterium halophilum TaxID=2053465 RepID=A0A2N5ZG31_MUIH1|nr:MAG: hypothetical protein C0601_06475 [Candidatus Muirbacterium halophilum]